MNRLITVLLVTPLLALPTWVLAQGDQTYATYITEEQWQMVNELPGVDRQIVVGTSASLTFRSASFIEDPSQEEVARALRIPSGRVA